MSAKLSPLTLGIHSRTQYLALPADRRYSGARVAYNLLRVGEDPTEDEIRIFEDICFSLRLSNGTFRTTFRNRFEDVDSLSIRLMKESFGEGHSVRIQDRAVSSGLTSSQWAKRVFGEFPDAQFEASDLLVELLEISGNDGEKFITEPDGSPLQYIRPPFVVALDQAESWRNPLLRFVASRALKRFRSLRDHDGAVPISCIHPEAQVLARTNPNFTFRMRSLFEPTPAECNVLRTMNILNRAYFSQDQLREGARTAFTSLQLNGIWIVGRTSEVDFTNHVTFFRRGEHAWQAIDRLGAGSEIEELALASQLAA